MEKLVLALQNNLALSEDYFKNFAFTINENSQEIDKNLGEIITNTIGFASDFVTVFDSLKDNINIDNFSNIFKNLPQNSKKYLHNLSDNIVSTFSNIGTKLKNWGLEGTFDLEDGAFDKVGDKIEDFFKNTGNKIKNHLSSFGSNLDSFFDSISLPKSFKGDFPKLNDSGFINTTKSFETTMNTMGSKINSVFSNTGDKIDDFIGNMGKKIGPSMMQVGNKITNTFGDASTSISSNMGNATKAIANNAVIASSTVSTTAASATASTGTVAAATTVALGPIIAIAAAILAVVAVGAILIEFFKKLYVVNEEFKTTVSEGWERIKNAFEPVKIAFESLITLLTTEPEEGGGIVEFFTVVVDDILNCIAGALEYIAGVIVGVIEFFKQLWEEHGTEISAKWVETWSGIKEFFSIIWEAISAVVQTVISVITEFWKKWGEDIMAVISVVWNFISSIFQGAIDFISGIFLIITGIFTGNGEKIKEGFAKIWEGIKEIFSGIVDFFAGIWNAIVSIFSKIGTIVGNAIGDAFRFVINSIIGFAENMINGFIKSINLAIKLINAIPGVNIPEIKLLSIQRLATGGIVDYGQLFIAREAGPELVGRLGNVNAVMNNDQIVASVSNGVYKAVMAAMSTNNSSGDKPLNITFKVGETEFGRACVNSMNSLSKQQGGLDLCY